MPKLLIIDRYIISRLFGHFGLIIFVLLMVVWLAASLRYIDLIAKNGVDLVIFVKFNSLLLVHIFNTSMPIACMLSAVVTTHQLINDREMVILKSTGYSDFQILKPFIIFGLLTFSINLFTSLFIMPKANFEFKNLRIDLQTEVFTMIFEDKTFNDQLPNKIVYVDKSENQGIRGVFLFDQTNPKDKITITAKAGSFANSPSGPKFILNDGTLQNDNASKDKVSISNFDSYIVDLLEHRAKEEKHWRKPDDLTITQLFNVYESDKSKYSRLLSEIHSRFTAPFYSTLLPILGALVLIKTGFKRRMSTKMAIYSAISSTIIFFIGFQLQEAAFKNNDNILWCYLFIILISLYCTYKCFGRRKFIN